MVERVDNAALGISLRKAELEAFLWDTNPWWRGQPRRPLPPMPRWLFSHTLQRLTTGLAPVTVLRGPRQVGTTTLQEHIIAHLLQHAGVQPQRILRMQCDELPSLKGLQDPILTLCRWFEQKILGGSCNAWVHQGEPVFLLFDEVQNLSNWAPQIKALVDHHAVRVLLTGSSALRIEHGRDSLAGRITTLELGTLLLREIAMLRGWADIGALLPSTGVKPLKERAFLEALHDHGVAHREVRDRAFAAFAALGGYPMTQVCTDSSRADVPVVCPYRTRAPWPWGGSTDTAYIHSIHSC